MNCINFGCQISIKNCSIPSNEMQLYDKHWQSIQFNKLFNKRHAPKSRFTCEDDDVLRTLVSKYGLMNWDLIASLMKNRTARMCHDRWYYYLDPSLNHKEWTKEEDLLLISKHNELGSRWVMISHFFEGRTDTQIKNRYNKLIRNGKYGIDVSKEVTNTHTQECFENAPQKSEEDIFDSIFKDLSFVFNVIDPTNEFGFDFLA